MTLPKLILPKHILKIVTKDDPPDEERRPTTPHLSYSQLAMYLRCSFQYRFRYILGMKERPKVSTSIGKGGHAALESNTKHKLKTGSDRPADEIVQQASDFMDFYLSDMSPSEYEKDVEPGALKDKQLAATKVYAVRDAAKVIPVGAETEINLDVNPYVPEFLREALEEPVRPVNMKLDLLYRDTTTQVQNHDQGVAIGVEDYKFVQRKKGQAEVNMSPQITTYLVGLRDKIGKWPTKAGIRMMHPGTKTEGPDSIPLLREPEHMTPEALERRMARIATQFAQAERGIREGIFIPTDDPMTCGWCGFRDRCQASLVDDFEAVKLREDDAA